MNPTLTYLMEELCAGVEIYYTGRTGSQYLKTAFILCDDYSELISKLFLRTKNKKWTEKKATSGHTNCTTPTCGRSPGLVAVASETFKNYHDILQEVEGVVGKKIPAQLERVKDLQVAMTNRRKRRNDFFHSTSLLDLSVTQPNCVRAFCDLLEYGEILFGADWRTALEASRNLATLEVMLQLERCAFSDPSIIPKVNKIIQDWPRNTRNNKKKGAHVAEYPEDLHFCLCVICGGKALRDKLKALMTP